MTSVTWERSRLFQSERMARLFLEVLFSYRAKENFLLHEFVLMPEHFHALISVPPGATIEKALQLIKGGFSFRAKRELGFASEIWERSFSDEYVKSQQDFRAKQRYIRQNPVEAGLVRVPEEYGYGSAGAGIELDPLPEHLRG